MHNEDLCCHVIQNKLSLWLTCFAGSKYNSLSGVGLAGFVRECVATFIKQISAYPLLCSKRNINEMRVDIPKKHKINIMILLIYVYINIINTIPLV